MSFLKWQLYLRISKWLDLIRRAGSSLGLTYAPTLERPEPDLPGVWLSRRKAPISLS